MSLELARATGRNLPPRSTASADESYALYALIKASLAFFPPQTWAEPR